MTKQIISVTQCIIVFLSVFLFGCAMNDFYFFKDKKEKHFIPQKQFVWQKKLSRLTKDKNKKFRIIQLGDSHTAADIFSHAARLRLQKKFGDGGIGLIAPVNIKGQQNVPVIQKSKNWLVLKNKSFQGDRVPLGGIMALSKKHNSTEIIPLSKNLLTQKVDVHFKANDLQHQLILTDSNNHTHTIIANKIGWQHQSINTLLPFKLEVPEGNVTLGQMNIENNMSGVIYSSLGINGARLSRFKHWREDWIDNLKSLQPDLLILAFGTNEAIDPDFNPQREKPYWQKYLSKLKKQLPNVGVILIGVPDLNQGDKQCQPLPNRQKVWRMQQQLAQEFQLILWSWKAAMGGDCSMFHYQQQGLSQKDGLHLTPKGYTINGKKFADFLIELAEKAK